MTSKCSHIINISGFLFFFFFLLLLILPLVVYRCMPQGRSWFLAIYLLRTVTDSHAASLVWLCTLIIIWQSHSILTCVFNRCLFHFWRSRNWVWKNFPRNEPAPPPEIMGANGSKQFKDSVRALRADDPSCRVLDCDGERVGDRGAKLVAESLRRNRHIRGLKLGDCRITDVGLARLTRVLCSNQVVLSHLRSLDLVSHATFGPAP